VFQLTGSQLLQGHHNINNKQNINMWHPVLFPKKNQYKLLHSVNTALLINNPWDMHSSGIMQHTVIIPYQRFGTTYQSHFQGYAPLSPVSPFKAVSTLLSLFHWPLGCSTKIGPPKVFTSFIANACETILLSFIIRHPYYCILIFTYIFSYFYYFYSFMWQKMRWKTHIIVFEA
jgi:hypothetical protein